METLRELKDEYLALMELGGSDDPEDQQAFLDTLEGINFEIGTKADSYVEVMDAFSNRADRIDAEIKRLTKRKGMLVEAVNRMNEVLKEAMISMDKKKIETDLHTFSLRKNGGVTPLIVDKDRVPDEYMKVDIKLIPDNDKIRKALDAGEELDFAHFGERGMSLQIK